VAKVRNMKMDCLNAEKPTLMFLSLAKVSNSDKNIICNRDKNGGQLENDFIVDYIL
jgi:hypothetical protein